MNSKKLITTIIITVIIIIVLIAGVILWRNGFLGKNSRMTQPGIAQPLTEIFSNKMTDDIYVEISAQATFAGMLNPKNIAEEISKKMNELLNKYHISTVEYGMYIQTLYSDKDRSATLDKKVSERLSELQKTGVK